MATIPFRTAVIIVSFLTITAGVYVLPSIAVVYCYKPFLHRDMWTLEHGFYCYGKPFPVILAFVYSSEYSAIRQFIMFFRLAAAMRKIGTPCHLICSKKSLQSSSDCKFLGKSISDFIIREKRIINYTPPPILHHFRKNFQRKWKKSTIMADI